MKKLIEHEFCYFNGREEITGVRFIFDDCSVIGYGFITDNLCFLDPVSKCNRIEYLTSGIESALECLSEFVDEESFNIINAVFMRKLGDYL